MATTTLTTARTAIYAILHADATFMGYITGLFADEAPQTTLPDYAVLAFQSPGADTLGAAGWRILSNPVLKLVVCGPQSHKANIEAAYARADALLCPSGQPTRNTGGTLAIYRESPFTLIEPQLVNSEVWVQFGGMYRVIL
jgi:hypothetical protein